MILQSYFEENNIIFEKFDYLSSNKRLYDNSQEIIRRFTGKRVVLMDSADLYMTPAIWKAVAESESIFIISIKGFDYIDPVNADVCLVNYTNDRISLERLV